MERIKLTQEMIDNFTKGELPLTLQDIINELVEQQNDLTVFKVQHKGLVTYLMEKDLKERRGVISPAALIQPVDQSKRVDFCHCCTRCGKLVDAYHIWLYRKDDKDYCQFCAPAGSYRVTK